MSGLVAKIARMSMVAMIAISALIMAAGCAPAESRYVGTYTGRIDISAKEIEALIGSRAPLGRFEEMKRTVREQIEQIELGLELREDGTYTNWTLIAGRRTEETGTWRLDAERDRIVGQGEPMSDVQNDQLIRRGVDPALIDRSGKDELEILEGGKVLRGSKAIVGGPTAIVYERVSGGG